VYNIFGPYPSLAFAAGVDYTYTFVKVTDLETNEGLYIYPLKEKNENFKITPEELIEVIMEQKTKPYESPVREFGTRKGRFDDYAKDYFRAHYSPAFNSMHTPPYSGYEELFKGATENQPNLDEQELDLAIRISMLEATWAEISHAIDININGIFGYFVDNLIGLNQGQNEEKNIVSEAISGFLTRNEIIVRRNVDDSTRAVLIPKVLYKEDEEIEEFNANSFIEVQQDFEPGS